MRLGDQLMNRRFLEMYEYFGQSRLSEKVLTCVLTGEHPPDNIDPLAAAWPPRSMTVIRLLTLTLDIDH